MKVNNDFYIPVFPGDNNTFMFDFPTLSGDNYYLFSVDSNCNYTYLTELDNTYGTKSPIGYSSLYPSYGKYEIDWESVFNAFGTGFYVFAVSTGVDGSGDETFNNSLPFHLTDGSKDGTFYVEVENTGNYTNFIHNEARTLYTKENYELTGIIERDSCRYYGRFLQQPTQSEETLIQYDNGVTRQGYTEDTENYELTLFYTRDELLQRLFHYGLTNNRATVTDDNSDQPFTFTKIDINNSESEESDQFPNSSNVYGAKFSLSKAIEEGFRR